MADPENKSSKKEEDERGLTTSKEQVAVHHQPIKMIRSSIEPLLGSLESPLYYLQSAQYF